MKFTIETPEFKAETESIKQAYRLLDIIGLEPVKDLVVKENFTTEIPNDKYLTITADDITCGGESVTEYNGNEIWSRDDVMKYVSKADHLFQDEHNAKLLELHVIQANNIAGEPMPDKNGKNCWLRCVFEINGARKITPWVFRGAYGSVADCGSDCASDCGGDVRYNASFRGSLFGSVGN